MICGSFRGMGLVPIVLCGVLSSGNAATAVGQTSRSRAITIAPRSIHPGDVVRVDVNGTADDRIGATLLSQSLWFAFDDARRVWTALAGVDLDVKPGSYRLRIEINDHVAVTRTIRVERKRFAVRHLRVPGGFVDPPADALEQIRLDNKVLAEAYARVTSRHWRGAFLPPVDGRATSNFGTRSFYNGVSRSPHAGVDFTSEPGTPVRASNHGTVAVAAPMYFTGNTVVVDHGARLFSVFAHLSEFHVKPGDLVSPETIVGLVGATGRVTGPHLHWSVRLNGARVDPIGLIAITRDN